jgi:hypothetical protein
LADEHHNLLEPDAVYSGMRVLCVGRHAYLSEHLCRYFRELGAECEPAVGGANALRVAGSFEPHAVVCDSDLVTTALFDSWAASQALAGVPVLAVSLTHRPDDMPPSPHAALARTIYLPGLDRDQAIALLANMHRPRGVSAPVGWPVSPTAPSARIR